MLDSRAIPDPQKIVNTIIAYSIAGQGLLNRMTALAGSNS
jgi:hypothetical protein